MLAIPSPSSNIVINAMVLRCGNCSNMRLYPSESIAATVLFCYGIYVQTVKRMSNEVKTCSGDGLAPSRWQTTI